MKRRLYHLLVRSNYNNNVLEFRYLATGNALTALTNGYYFKGEHNFRVFPEIHFCFYEQYSLYFSVLFEYITIQKYLRV